MSLEIDETGQRTAGFLEEKWGKPVSLVSIEKIFGGASRETFRLEVKVGENSRPLILRRDPPTSLIDTERELEYNAYRAIWPTDIPVPEPLFLEQDPEVLGSPFSIMAAIEGGMTDTSLLDEQGRRRIGTEKWKILGRLAAKNPADLGFDAFLEVPEPQECADRELSYWERVILDDEIHPQPVARAAIRWLRAHMPPPAQGISVVHGDYRSGNFLFDPDDGISGILDWEMCHLGDPLEDLAWSMDPLWSWDDPALAGRLLPHSEAVGIWEEESGLKVDRNAFRWWRIFASVKGLAIWISSSEDFHHGASKDAILAMAGWVMTDRQNRILLDYLSPHSDRKRTGGLS